MYRNCPCYILLGYGSQQVTCSAGDTLIAMLRARGWQVLRIWREV